jgi:hypothetical protein
MPYCDIKSIQRRNTWFYGSHIAIVNRADGCALMLHGIIEEEEFVNHVKSCIGDNSIKDKDIADVVKV